MGLVKVVLGFIVMALGSACRLEAGVISTLHNTGVDNSGSPLADLAVDQHYTLISVPAGSGLSSNAFVADSTKFPLNGAWMSNSSTSKWIAPLADQSTFPNDTGSGFYTYRTTFNLSGFDSSTAILTGKWSTDNFGMDILINGVSTGITHTSEPPSTFSYFSPFSINSGFVSGVNTLDFIVHNPAIISPTPGLFNPTGLRVEITGTATELAAVPEPSSIAVFGIVVGIAITRCGVRRKSGQQRLN